MNSRENQTNESVNSTSPAKKYTKSFVQAGFASGIITTATFPFYIAQVRTMTSSAPGPKLGPSAVTNFLLANYKMLFSAYTKNVQQSMAKSTIYSHREVVENNVASLHENQSHEGIASLESRQSVPLKYKLTYSFVTAGILTPIDLFCTQYFAAMKTRFALCNQNAPKPYFPTMASKAQYAKSGLSTRACGIGSNALFYVLGQNLVNEEFNKIFPREQYGYTGTVLATITTGLTGGMVSNMFDVLFTNIIKDTKIEMTPPIPYDVLKESYKQGKPIPVNFKIDAPGLVKMGSQLIAEQGPRCLFRGSSYAMLMTTIAYGSYHVAEGLTNWLFSEGKPQVATTVEAVESAKVEQIRPQNVQTPSVPVHEAKQASTPIPSDALKAKQRYGLFPENQQLVNKSNPVATVEVAQKNKTNSLKP